MRHVGSVSMETERLVLRGLEPGDAEVVFRNWTGDAEVARYMPWNPHGSAAETEAWLRQVEQNRREDPRRYAWGIVLRETGEPIGDISVNFEGDDLEEAGEIGYALGRAWRHRGYAGEALTGVCQFLKETVGVRRVIGKVCITNLPSQAVLVRAGFRLLGAGVYESFDGERIFDSFVYGLEL